MRTQDLFSMAVIVKDLGNVMVAVMNSLQNACINEVDCIHFKTIINDYWERYSLIEGLEIDIVRDESQVEGYEILVHRIDDPHILVSVNFNLS